MTAPGGFEEIARGFYLEGLHVEDDAVWYTDVVQGGVRRVGSDGVLLPDRFMIGGLLVNHDGKLLVAGQGDIAWVDPATTGSGALVDGFQGTNEMYPTADGGLVFGEMDLPSILSGGKPGPSAIHHVAVDRTVTRLWGDLSFANGLGVSADGHTLFFNESFSASRAFPIAQDGRLETPRLLADKPDCDGMALDAEGNVWITGFGSDFLMCVAADGTEIRRLPLPGKAATSVRFGGADMRDLYVNVVDPAAARCLANGTPLTEQTSALYRTRAPVAGAPIARTAFDLRS